MCKHLLIDPIAWSGDWHMRDGTIFEPQDWFITKVTRNFGAHHPLVSLPFGRQIELPWHP
jgi:hypothetical protein